MQGQIGAPIVVSCDRDGTLECHRRLHPTGLFIHNPTELGGYVDISQFLLVSHTLFLLHIAPTTPST